MNIKLIPRGAAAPYQVSHTRVSNHKWLAGLLQNPHPPEGTWSPPSKDSTCQAPSRSWRGSTQKCFIGHNIFLWWYFHAHYIIMALNFKPRLPTIAFATNTLVKSRLPRGANQERRVVPRLQIDHELHTVPNQLINPLGEVVRIAAIAILNQTKKRFHDFGFQIQHMHLLNHLPSCVVLLACK